MGAGQQGPPPFQVSLIAIALTCAVVAASLPTRAAVIFGIIAAINGAAAVYLAVQWSVHRLLWRCCHAVCLRLWASQQSGLRQEDLDSPDISPRTWSVPTPASSLDVSRLGTGTVEGTIVVNDRLVSGKISEACMADEGCSSQAIA